MSGAGAKYMDVYPIEEGSAYIGVTRDVDGVMRYDVLEPVLTDAEKALLARAKEYVLESKLEDGEAAFKQFLARARVEGDTAKKLAYYFRRDTRGYGKLDPIMRDPYVEDVHVNGRDGRVFIWHSRYENMRTNVALTEEEVRAFIAKVSNAVERQVNSANPILEGLLPEGARVEVVLREVAANGDAFTIRKFRGVPYTVVDLIGLETAGPDALAYLWMALDKERNVVIVGPTGAGKTTLLNALLFLLRPDARIITIEDTRELRLLHEQWLPLLVRPGRGEEREEIDMMELLKVAMRMRPDYLILGEVRGEEAYVLFQAFASGHHGLTTIHADNAEGAVRRFVTKPMDVPTALLGMAHVYVSVRRVRTGAGVRRSVWEVKEYLDYTDRPVFTDLLINGKMDASKSSVVGKDELDELGRRSRLLREAARHGFNDYRSVFQIIKNYYLEPEATLKTVEAGALP
ncbi:secretion system protein E [Thermocladium modestius]|uniref:Secretion system protein E n=1 Tax=Thermocladium modestius TaxID=62609 RepID=A0A830GW29_9CREN|nr:type II/IV secretion system ATPase subunit [Thermocladium modestius]GGP22499.1 secretion system protein E [Thermocladium modestius]